MGIDLKGRSFLTLMDFTPEEIRYLLDLAKELKAKKKAGIRGDLLAGKNIVLLFEKTSTRTRCSFEVAAADEGGYATFLDPKSSQMGKKESIADTARVLGGFYDGIEYRGYSQAVVEELAANAGVPVWNGLTDEDHPTQILADIMTIEVRTIVTIITVFMTIALQRVELDSDGHARCDICHGSTLNHLLGLVIHKLEATREIVVGELCVRYYLRYSSQLIVAQVELCQMSQLCSKRIDIACQLITHQINL